MNLLLCLLILLIGLIRLRKEYKPMADWLTPTALKWLGSGAGSVVAVIFRPSGDVKSLLVRWAIGTWVGGIGTGAVISIAALPSTEDMVLFVASGLSVGGYMLIEVLLSPEIRAALKSWAANRAAK